MKVKLSELRGVVREELRLAEGHGGKLTGQALRDRLSDIAVELGDDQGWDIQMDAGYLTDSLNDQERHSGWRWDDAEARKLAKQVADEWNASVKRDAGRSAADDARWFRESLQLEQMSRPAEALYTLIGRIPQAPNALLRPSTYKHIQTLIDEFRKDDPSNASLADKLAGVLSGVVKQVSTDVKGASSGKLPKFLTDELGSLTGAFKKLVGHEQTTEALVRIIERKMREADVSDGSRVPWGDDRHVKDLESRLSTAVWGRDKQKRGSEARALYARLIQRLKSELASAKKSAEKRPAGAQKARARKKTAKSSTPSARELTRSLNRGNTAETQKKRKKPLKEAPAQSVIELSGAKLMSAIARLGPDEVSQSDYVDAATGEVVLEKGEPARSSELHPQNVIDTRKRRVARGADSASRIDVFGSTPDERVASFEDAYDVRKELLSDSVGMSPEELADSDIEDRMVPDVITRKDGRPFDADDVDNIHEYVNEYAADAEALGDIELDAQVAVGDVRAPVWPGLY